MLPVAIYFLKRRCRHHTATRGRGVLLLLTAGTFPMLLPTTPVWTIPINQRAPRFRAKLDVSTERGECVQAAIGTRSVYPR